MAIPKSQFEGDLARVLRRAMRLRAALAGSADVKYVSVKACKVKAHERGAHKRAVITLRKR